MKIKMYKIMGKPYAKNVPHKLFCVVTEDKVHTVMLEISKYYANSTCPYEVIYMSPVYMQKDEITVDVIRAKRNERKARMKGENHEEIILDNTEYIANCRRSNWLARMDDV